MSTEFFRLKRKGETMAILEILSGALEALRLKKSRLRKCRDAIAAHDERIRDLYDELARRNSDAETLEAAVKKLREKFAAASPASQELLEPQIRSLAGDFKRLRELQTIALRNIEKEKHLRQARMIELENIMHPADTAKIEDAIDAKLDALDDLKDEDVEISRLAETAYEREESQEGGQHASHAPAAAAKERADALLRDLDNLLGKENPPEASESAPELA